MKFVFQRYWFLLSLLLLIPLGLVLAQYHLPDWFETFIDHVPTSWCTATILFLMSVTLDSRRLWDSMRYPLPVLTACLVNQLMVPCMCLPMLALQKSADMKAGLLIAASVPCTMAAASVWTRRAGGNDAVSLLVTLLTNGLCFLVTPAWLAIGVHFFGTADPVDGLQFGAMVLSLTLAALIPAVCGQLVRQHFRVRHFVDVRKTALGATSQLIILLLVFVSSYRGGQRFGDDGIANNLRHSEFAVAWICCIILHVLAMLLAWWLTGFARFSEADRRACIIAGSQKTLPIGILVSQSTGLPLSLMPMLMYHTSQLFIDTWVADRLKASDQSRVDETT